MLRRHSEPTRIAKPLPRHEFGRNNVSVRPCVFISECPLHNSHDTHKPSHFHGTWSHKLPAVPFRYVQNKIPAIPVGFPFQSMHWKRSREKAAGWGLSENCIQLLPIPLCFTSMWHNNIYDNPCLCLSNGCCRGRGIHAIWFRSFREGFWSWAQRSS